MAKTKKRVLQQFRLPADVSDWLQKKAAKAGKTKTRLVEEALRTKMVLKETA